MNKSAAIAGLPFAILLTVLFACGPDKDALVRQMVTERTQAYKNREIAACRARLLREAEHLVDSILLAEAQADIRDSALLSHPGKPLLPPEVPPVDTALVKPIFQDSSGG